MKRTSVGQASRFFYGKKKIRWGREENKRRGMRMEREREKRKKKEKKEQKKEGDACWIIEKT